jgi:hypothetical protein
MEKYQEELVRTGREDGASIYSVAVPNVVRADRAGEYVCPLAFGMPAELVERATEHAQSYQSRERAYGCAGDKCMWWVAVDSSRGVCGGMSLAGIGARG